MVSFAFTAEQEAFRETLDAFVRKVLLPGYRERAAAPGFPMDILAELGELGLLGIGMPEEYGGSGIVIGGRGAAAVRRTAAHGHGWLGIFCSDRRFAATRREIAAAAADLGRPVPSWYGMNVWCGLDRAEGRARELLAAQMEALYRLPLERFERLAPAGMPAQVAEWLAPFIEAGAGHLTLIPAASSPEAAVDYAAEVRALLAG